MIFTRNCRTCRADKPADEYYGRRAHCRPCELSRRKSKGGGKPSVWRQEDPLNVALGAWIRTSERREVHAL